MAVTSTVKGSQAASGAVMKYLGCFGNMSIHLSLKQWTDLSIMLYNCDLEIELWWFWHEFIIQLASCEPWLHFYKGIIQLYVPIFSTHHLFVDFILFVKKQQKGTNKDIPPCPKKKKKKKKIHNTIKHISGSIWVFSPRFSSTFGHFFLTSERLEKHIQALQSVSLYSMSSF